ncbi:MAG: DUF4397 domain-containing protein [Ignavibacteria bacterium]|nr:DUF4397 domain-containing protein [Ignavibacteria bacterium]
MNRVFKQSIFVVVFLLLGYAIADAQVAYVTFVHNSPDASLKKIDLYVGQSGVETKIEDLAFQDAINLNSLVIIFGGFELTYKVAPSTSSSSSEAVYTGTITPEVDKGYVAIFGGTSSPTGYVPNPDGKTFEYNVRSFLVASEIAQPVKLGAVFVHGVTDLEASDIYLRGNNTPITINLKYREQMDTTAELTRVKATIDVTKTGDKTKVLASYSVDLTSITSQVAVFVVSGFKTPGDNNGSADSLALLAVLEDGRVIKYPVLSGSQTSRVQMVHASADPTLQVVDVWINGVRVYDNLGFKKAGGFQNFASGTPMEIAIASATSTSPANPIATITIDPIRPGRTYTMVLHGVSDTSKFVKNPEGRDTRLGIALLENALEASPVAGKNVVRTAHFAPDLPRVTVKSSQTTFLSQGSYSESNPEYLAAEGANDTLWVSDATTDSVLAGFVGSFGGSDKAYLVVITGFLAPDAGNQNGPKRSLMVVSANGGVEPSLIEVTPPMSVAEDLVPATLWSVGPNPASDKFTLRIPLTQKVLRIHGGILTAHVFTQQGLMLGIYPMDIQGLNASVVISTSAFANGSYMVHVTTADGQPVGNATVAVVR